MPTDLEPIWRALHDRLEHETGHAFETVVRGLLERRALEALPALEIIEGTETPTPNEFGLPPLWVISGTLAVSARASPDDPSPSSGLNALILAVKSALERRPDEVDADGYHGAAQYWTNLGGRVHAFSVGPIEKFHGESTGEVWARIPVQFSVF